MSLLLNAITEPCVLLNRTIVEDGYGGYEQRWVDGITFDAAISYDSSTQGLMAQAQGVTALYTVVTKRALNLQYHDAFRRIKDGKIFRVTTDGDDNLTPSISSLDMRSVRAEEWQLPSEAVNG